MLSRSARSVRHISRALLACACAFACVLAAAGCSKNEPPSGTVRYETEDAVVNMGLLLHGYAWGGEANDPAAPTELSDDDVPDIEVAGATEVRVSFSQPATEVEAVRYTEDGNLKGVECALEDGAAMAAAAVVEPPLQEPAAARNGAHFVFRDEPVELPPGVEAGAGRRRGRRLVNAGFTLRRLHRGEAEPGLKGAVGERKRPDAAFVEKVRG